MLLMIVRRAADAEGGGDEPAACGPGIALYLTLGGDPR